MKNIAFIICLFLLAGLFFVDPNGGAASTGLPYPEHVTYEQATRPEETPEKRILNKRKFETNRSVLLANYRKEHGADTWPPIGFWDNPRNVERYSY